MAVLAAAAFGLLLYISRDVNGGFPHVPDEVSYVFQAKILASFHLTAPIPPAKDAFDFFYPSLLADSGGRWASIYPFGHPLMLAIGELIRAVWLIPPLIGALSILLIYRVGKQTHGAHVGSIAAVLLAFSPFFQMTASNLMSHNTAAFYLLMSPLPDHRQLETEVAVVRACRHLLRPAAQYAAVDGGGAGPTIRLPIHFRFRARRGQRMAIIRRCFAFAAGVLLMVGMMYLYSLGTTGSLATGYGNNTALETVVGFGAKNSVARGMQNEQSQLVALLPSLNGWPIIVGLALVLMPFMLGSRSRWDLFLLLGAVFAMGVWTLYESNGLMHGPRYWFEAVPFLMLLSARGLTLLQERLAHWTRLILGTTAPNGGAHRRGPYVRICGAGSAAGDKRPRLDAGEALRHRAQRLHAADHLRAERLQRRKRHYPERCGRQDIHNALVLVKVCPNWQCYGTVFWKDSPDFNGDVVYAKDTAEMESPYVLEKYVNEGRKIYVADYMTGAIAPYEPPAPFDVVPGG